MKLTEQAIEALKSLNGGWNKPVLELIGVSWPPEKGWKRRIHGKEMPNQDYAKALGLRDAKLKPSTFERLSNIVESERSLNERRNTLSEPR